MEATACTETHKKNEKEHQQESSSEETSNNQGSMLESLTSKEECNNNTNSSKPVMLSESKITNDNCSCVSLSEALEPFSVLRRSYLGSHDSIKCVDVDVEAKRIYAASWSEGVFVWGLYSHKPIAVLRHQSWVNALKCFPSFSLQHCKKEKTQTSRIAIHKFYERGRYVKTVYVLTGCEDGVLSAWDAVTFSVHARLKLSLNSITAIYIEPQKYDREIRSDAELGERDCVSNLVESDMKCNDLAGSKRNDNSDNNICKNEINSDRSYTIKNDHKTGGRVYVAAMHHVFILWVDSSLTLIHDLIHPTECLCVTSLASSVATFLIVGQENGQLICWNSSNWEYTDTLEYPGDKSDVNRDCLQGSSIYEHKLDVMTGQLLEEPFQYNTLRYNLHINKNNANVQNTLLEQSDTSTKHLVTIKGQTPLAKGVEINKKNSEHTSKDDDDEKIICEQDQETRMHTSASSNHNPFHKTSEHDKHWAKWMDELMHTREDVSYDDRRVTCLSSSDTMINTAFCNLYSGHANGVLLIWQSPFPNMPIVLMKKLHLFPHNAWVHTLVTIPIVTFTESVKCGKALTNKKTIVSETPTPMKVTEPTTKPKLKSKKHKTDTKSVTHSKVANPHAQKVKAGQSTDKHIKDEKTKRKPEAISHKACNQNDKHSVSEMKESEYLFACSDHGAVKYLKVDCDNVSSVGGPGILAYSACCWSDCTAKHQISEDASVETKQTKLSTNVNVAMGSYDGRLERYDVTAVIDRLQKQC